jgi:hypothetical protein
MKKTLFTLILLGTINFAQGQNFCNDLFFSEVVEGTGNDKAFEVYNPTNAPITLSNYRIVRYSNGSPTGVDSLTLSGTILPNATWVVANGQIVSASNSPACDTALQALANQLSNVYPDPLYANGDDAILLVKISPYAIVDIFGKIGEDPGQSWSDVFPFTDAQGTWWTKDHTLIRKPFVTTGVTSNPIAFNVTLQWDSLPKDNWTNLGIHISNCGNVAVNEITENIASVTTFPNPSNGNFIIKTSSALANVKIYNTLGENIFSTPINTNLKEENFNLSNYAHGIYFMRVELQSGKVIVLKHCIQ